MLPFGNNTCPFSVVFLKDAQLFAQRYPIPFMEVSAFTGLNVDNLFSKIGTFTLNVLIDMRYWSNVRSRWLDIGQVLFVSVNKNTQKTRPIFGHLDRTSLVSKGFITWRKKRTFTCGTSAGNPERASRVAKQNAGFASSCLLADSAIKKEGDWMERDESFIFLRQPLSVVCHSNRTFYSNIQWCRWQYCQVCTYSILLWILILIQNITDSCANTFWNTVMVWSGNL